MSLGLNESGPWAELAATLQEQDGLADGL